MESFKELSSLSLLWQVDRNLLRQKCDLVRNAATERKNNEITTKEQGDRLEDLVNFLFGCAPKLFSPKGAQLSGISEKDDIVEVLETRGFLTDWPPYILVECKNWSSPVGKDEVEAFIGKIRRASAHVGILWSQNGVTGEEWKAAEGLVKASYSSEKFVVMVYTNEHLERLIKGENFIDMLEQQYRARRFQL